jgi:hypothetical protein
VFSTTCKETNPTLSASLLSFPTKSKPIAIGMAIANRGMLPSVDMQNKPQICWMKK